MLCFWLQNFVSYSTQCYCVSYSDSFFAQKPAFSRWVPRDSGQALSIKTYDVCIETSILFQIDIAHLFGYRGCACVSRNKRPLSIIGKLGRPHVAFMDWHRRRAFPCVQRLSEQQVNYPGESFGAL